MAHQLLRSYDDVESHERARDIVSHVNAGYLSSGAVRDPLRASVPRCCEQMRADGTVNRVIELELVAAMQAKSACSYDLAIEFLTAAVQLIRSQQEASCDSEVPMTLSSAALPAMRSPSSYVDVGMAAEPLLFLRVDDASWTHSRALCMRLYHELAQCLFLTNDYVASQQCIEYALAQLSDTHDRALFHELHVQSLYQQSDLPGSLAAGLAHISEMGIDLPTAISPELRAWLDAVPAGADDAILAQHPVFSSEEMSDTSGIVLLGSLTLTMYFSGDLRTYRLVLAMLDLTRRHGISPDAGHAFSIFAVSQWREGNHARAFAFGRMAQMVMERFGDQSKSTLPRVAAALWGLVFTSEAHSTTWGET